MPPTLTADVAATPREVVDAFLAALEARDLPTAARYLAPGVAMTFPGGQAFADLESLVAWSKDRYRAVARTTSGSRNWRSMRVASRSSTAAARWRGSGPCPCFAGVRFIDRFEIDDAGRIVDQQVWNDLGEARR